MKRFLFGKSISYWQWLTMSAGLFAAFSMGTGWGLLAWLVIMLVGAAIEGVVDGVFGI
ncbi:hypothetical protein PFWH6_3926 [Pseudomonas fluorescens WH6]|nr:hypothetical protein PFWH6_3926 [Pseudomonas fluorescens WH6]